MGVIVAAAGAAVSAAAVELGLAAGAEAFSSAAGVEVVASVPDMMMGVWRKDAGFFV